METPQARGQEQGVMASGILHRIWKYKFHYAIVIPGLLLLFVFKGIPLVTGFIMAFKNYNIFSGLFSSPWIGLDNFTNLFNVPEFGKIIANTLILKFGYIFVCGIIALVIALGLSGLRSRKLSSLVSAMALVPYFIPSVVVCYVLMTLLSAKQMEKLDIHLFVLGDNRYFRPTLILAEALKTCGIPVLLALAAIQGKRVAAGLNGAGSSRFMRTDFFPAIRAICAFALLQLSTVLTTDYELIGNLYNPLVYQTADTVDTYLFRSGLLTMRFGNAAALELLKFIIQAAGTFAAYWLVRGLFLKDLFGGRTSKHDESASPRGEGRNIVGIAVMAIGSVLVLLAVCYICIYPFTTGSPSGRSVWSMLSMGRMIGNMGLNLASVVVCMLITVTLAYPLTVKDLPGRSMYKILLLLAMTAGSGAISEYLMFKNLGMINTVFPQYFLGFFAVINVFVLKSIFNGSYAVQKEQAAAAGRGELHSFFMLFIPKIWKPLIALGVLQFVALWNSTIVSLMYAADSRLHTPATVFRSIMLGGVGKSETGLSFDDPLILQAAALITIPPLVLLFVFRKWLTSDVLLSQVRKL